MRLAPASAALLCALLLAPCAPAQPVRAANADDYQRLAEREAQAKRQQRLFGLRGTGISVSPETPTALNELRIRVSFRPEAFAPESCPDTVRASVARKPGAIRVQIPLMPCTEQQRYTLRPLELSAGHVEAGEYSVEVDIQNDVGLSPAHAVPLAVRPVTTDEQAMMVAVGESAADVAAQIARRKPTQEVLDAALFTACTRMPPGRNVDDPHTVGLLLAAGARPEAALHGAAGHSPWCLRLLIAAGADVNQDLASQPGIYPGGVPSQYRFKPGPYGTPLHFAVRARNPETTRILLEAGADPNRTFAGGQSAFGTAFMPEMGDSPQLQQVRQLMAEHGGSRTVAQRAAAGKQAVEGAAKAGAFLGICWFSVLFGGKCP